MNIDVSLRTLDSFDIKEVESAVREGFADMKIERLLRPKMRVLLKVCMPDNLHPDKALTTNPSIARGIINVLTDLGVSVVVADSPYGKYTDTHLEEVYITTGMLDVANSSKCELDRSLATGMLFTPNGIKARSIQILDIVNQVDAIINLGKIKMNDRIGFSGVCDNIFGLVPGEVKTQIIRRLDRVKDYNDYIIDMLDALEDKIILNIADAVVAVENGETQRMLSCLGMSSNPYALDAAFVNIIGMDPKNTIIKQAMDRAKIDIKTPYKMVGEKIDKFKVEDFAFSEVEEDKKLNDYTATQQKIYFNNNIEHVVIKPNTCKGCTICSKKCPVGAILMKYDKNGELYAEVDYKKCIFCNQCKMSCPYSVIDVKTPLGHRSIQKQINKYNKDA